MRVVLVICVVMLAGCTKEAQPSPPPESPPAPSTRASWVKVRSAAGVPLVEAPARVLAAPESNAAIGAPLLARVVKIHVRPGATVAKGGPLVDVLMPELVEAVGRLKASQTQLATWMERERQLASLRADGLARTADVAEAQAKVAELRAAVQAARAVLLVAGVDEHTALSSLGSGGVLPLKSPIAGTVVEVSAQLGESREPTAGPLVRVSGGGEPLVEARVLPLNTEAHWELVTASGQRVPVVRTGESPSVDPVDGRRLSWFAPERGTAPLLPGTIGKLVLRSEGAGGLIAVPVPVRAVGRDHEASFLIRAESGERVPVSVVTCSGAECVVKSTLRPGEEILSDTDAAQMPAEPGT